ncbi:YesL family protein [Metabacillus schmidteae]|uniref:YesL family protein n=1 Tax=Metabacillus schmidteae TaxID=2730405 RepID=UPI00158B8D2D|nr:YesL family protein [Metabacillus schmidteae]
METHGMMSSVNNILEWISRLALLNILWIGFSLLGFVVLGFYPATVAMFAVVRRWAMGDLEAPVFSLFWGSYKKEFLKSNMFGAVLSVVGIILFIDFQFLKQASPMVQNLMNVPFLIISLIFVCSLLYMFPMYVHYNMKVFDVLKNSFFVMIMNPFKTFIMLISSVGLVILLSFAPPLMIVCSGNVLALVMSKPAMNAFNSINHKNETVHQ